MTISGGPAEYEDCTSQEPTRPEAARAIALSHGSEASEEDARAADEQQLPRVADREDPHEGDDGAGQCQQREHVRLAAAGGRRGRHEGGDRHEAGHAHDADGDRGDDRAVDAEAPVQGAQQDRDDEGEGAHGLDDHDRRQRQRDHVRHDARTQCQQTCHPVRGAQQAQDRPQPQGSGLRRDPGHAPMLEERPVGE
jgi:hypothetical protein